MSTAQGAAGRDVGARKASVMVGDCPDGGQGAPEPSSALSASRESHMAVLELVTGSGTHWHVLAAVPMGDMA